LASIVSSSALITALGVILAFIKLRRDKTVETEGKMFRVPGGHIVSMLSIALTLWFLSGLSANKL